MTLNRFGRFIALSALTLLVASVTTGCMPFSKLKSAEDVDMTEDPSFKGFWMETGRGLTNVTLSWLEIPSRAEYRIRKNQFERDDFSLINSSYDGLFGLIDGCGRTVQRVGVGLIELTLAPFPPYGPYVDPPHPLEIYPVRPKQFED